MSSGANLVILGVDGLDYEVVTQIGQDVLPNLFQLVINSTPHASVFPPDSVPSWTTITTGEAPEAHGQLKNANFMLEGNSARTEAALTPHQHDCFWDHSPSKKIAVINPFLAFPPWSPSGSGAMISGPSFSEESPKTCDPHSLLTEEIPPRMGGFAGIPTQRELEPFVEHTMSVAEAQFAYSLRQLESRRWDLFFHTNLTVDRIQHYAWRHYDKSDPTFPGGKLSHLIPQAHKQVDNFLKSVISLLQPDDCLVVLSDHGHGQRASVGVNLNEIFRRQGLLFLDQSNRVKRTVERTKTSLINVASACHAEEQMTWIARKLPGKQALKSGDLAGKRHPAGVSVPDVAGSNPFGGIQVGDEGTIQDVLDVVTGLEHEGRKVFRWCLPAEEVLHTGDNSSSQFPTLLFELDPTFGPSWNMYGKDFSPIITHKVQSGGHTRQAVFACTDPEISQPNDSMGVNQALRELVRRFV